MLRRCRPSKVLLIEFARESREFPRRRPEWLSAVAGCKCSCISPACLIIRGTAGGTGPGLNGILRLKWT